MTETSNKKLNDIDYRPLGYMNNAWETVIKEKFKVPSWIFWFIIALITFGLLYVSVEIGFFFPVLVYSYLAAKVLNHKSKVWKRFAEANGWGVTTFADILTKHYSKPGLDGLIQYLEYKESGGSFYIPPGLLNHGHSQRIGDIVHAKFEGHECDMFMYRFSTGSGKSEQTHYYTIARVTLDRPFPHLILDSKHSRAIKDRGDATDSVKLEGNFSNHFSLYFSNKDHINALSIITPDVMQTLLESNTYQDIEIVDNFLFFMVHSDVRTPNAVPVLFQSIDQLADEIKHKAKTLRYQPQMSTEARYIAQAALKSSQSADKVVAYIAMAIFILVGLPFLFIIALGLLTAFAGS